MNILEVESKHHFQSQNLVMSVGGFMKRGRFFLDSAV